MNRQDFFAMPKLSASFPLVFANGARWIELWGSCGDCDKRIADENTRGKADPVVSYRDSMPKTFIVDALGLCQHCDVITTFQYRLHQDMSMSGMKNGKWALWLPRERLWFRIKKFLGFNH